MMKNCGGILDKLMTHRNGWVFNNLVDVGGLWLIHYHLVDKRSMDLGTVRMKLDKASDVQYDDIPDGRSFLGTPRYYRVSILVLQRAVQNWNNCQKLKFVINFGDIVDGFCPKDQSLSAVKKVINGFDNFNGHVYHMIGNHCLYNLPRHELLPLLKILALDRHAYYDFSPIPEYRFIKLDGYDISAIGWPNDHPNTEKALKFLTEKNPNSEKNSPEGLVNLERRFPKFNGAVGKKTIGLIGSCFA
ncbi:hypothetical protein AgCh_037113 [Apium graveolens]